MGSAVFLDRINDLVLNLPCYRALGDLPKTESTNLVYRRAVGLTNRQAVGLTNRQAVGTFQSREHIVEAAVVFDDYISFRNSFFIAELCLDAFLNGISL